MKKISLFLVVLMLLCLVGCGPKQDDDIYILYTNDIHCSISENLGYAGISAFKNEVESEHKYVTLVDNGDFSQGSSLGTLSHGEKIIEIMNKVGYDIVTIGNHDFDYGMDNLKHNIDVADFDFIGCNFNYIGTNENKLSEVKPYVIKEYGRTKIAFIGVLTPESVTKSTPTIFVEDNKIVYTFCYGDDGKELFNKVQETVDEVRNEKVDYVILMCHLGTADSSAPYDAYDLIANTSGVDAVLDAHSHTEIVGEMIPNREGKDVLITSTGSNAKNIGELIITKEGKLESMLVSEYEKKDEEVSKLIDDIQDEFKEKVNEVICLNEADLTINIDGYRAVRNRETTAGNFSADALRIVSGMDIGVINGGGVRHDIPKGEVTYDNMLAVMPFQNQVTAVYATGQQILDLLEVTSKDTEKLAYLDDKATGEFGGFLQVSGLKYTIDTSIESSVVFENEFFKEIAGERRVKDVYVLQNGEYVPIDPQKKYSVAALTYQTTLAGDGVNVLLDCESIPCDKIDGLLDVEVLIEYAKENLNGVIPESYSQLEGRITVE